MKGLFDERGIDKETRKKTENTDDVNCIYMPVE